MSPDIYRPDEARVREELSGILASTPFIHSQRMRRLLEFCVENTLDGNRDQLKESIIGIAVFDRGHNFDPRTDSIVRVEARRLRLKLNSYYASEGQDHTLEIAFEPGSYVPLFRARDHRG